jgi:hypothetical protein
LVSPPEISSGSQIATYLFSTGAPLHERPHLNQIRFIHKGKSDS